MDAVFCGTGVRHEEENDMLLLFDVGNTHVTIGGYDGDTLLFTGRVASDRHKTEDEFAMIIESVLHMHGYSVDDVEDGAICRACHHSGTRPRFSASLAQAHGGRDHLARPWPDHPH